MTLLPSFLSLSSAPPYPSMAFPPSSLIRLQSVSLGIHSTCGHKFQIYAPMPAQKRVAVIAMASADSQEPATEGGDDHSDDEEDNIPIQNLPLESKLQLKLERKMKMKITKKIRLRRKRLMRKRRMRKRGSWPPSKMKKLKNV